MTPPEASSTPQNSQLRGISRLQRVSVIALLALATLNVPMALYAASFGPGAPSIPSTPVLLSVATWFLLGIVWVLWSGIAFVRWLRRGRTRRLTLLRLGWFALPCLLVAASLATSANWPFRWRFAGARAAFQDLATEVAGTGDGDTVVINRAVKGIYVESGSIVQGAVVLRCGHYPDGEHGLIFAPGGSLPAPPVWARHESRKRVVDDWWRYTWTNE